MDRRTLLRCAASFVALPMIAHSKQRTPTIGMLWHASSEKDEGSYFVEFMQGLRDVGYREGDNIHVEHRYAAEHYDRFPSQAAELISLGVEVLVASIRPAALAAQKATSTIPIVFCTVADPIESGLVDSLNRPGKNLTGLSTMSIELGAKRLEMTKEALPGLKRIALLVNAADPELAARFIKDNREAASSLAIELMPIEVRSPEELEAAFMKATEAKVDAVVPVIDSMFFNQRAKLGALGLKFRMPMMVHNVDMVSSGPLMAFGPNSNVLFRRTGAFIDKILRGVKPADIPVEMPSLFELRINTRTARALNLDIPPSVLMRATELVD